MITVRELMKTHTQALVLEDTLQTALDRLDVYQALYLPVVDAARHVIGSVSEHACTWLAWQEYQRGNLEAANLPVSNVMEATIAPVMETAAVNRELVVRSLETEPWIPVTNEEGALIGTLNRIDIIQALQDGILSVDLG